MIACSICFLSFEENHKIISTKKCGHAFHEVRSSKIESFFPKTNEICYFQDCIKQWLRTSKTCPQCRCICREKHLKRLYLFSISKESLVENFSLELKKLRREKEQCQKFIKETLKDFNSMLTIAKENVNKTADHYRAVAASCSRKVSVPVNIAGFQKISVNLNRNQENRKLIQHGILVMNLDDFQLLHMRGRQPTILLNRREENMKIKRHLKRLN